MATTYATRPVTGAPPQRRPEPLRPAAFAGAVFFGLILLVASLTSGSPTATDTGGQVVDFVTAHDGRLQLAAAALGLAMPAALLFLAGLFRVLTRAEGGEPRLAVASLAGGVLAAAATVTGALVLGTLASRIDGLSADSAGLLWTMFLLSFGGTLLGQLLMIGAAAVVSLRRQVFARWFGIASLLLAALSTVGATTIGFDATGVQIVAGVMVVANSVWIFVVSTFLWRRPALG